MVFPCGFCLSEVHDDQEAILCEASCHRWFHRDCTGLTEPAYGLLTRESAAVWACDLCLKTKEIQAVSASLKTCTTLAEGTLRGRGGGGGGVERVGGSSITSPSSKYGVAVRVQGIAGQPYVVLKEGEKGDSYGVQLKSEALPKTPPPVQAPPKTPPSVKAPPQSAHSLPRRKVEGSGADFVLADAPPTTLPQNSNSLPWKKGGRSGVNPGTAQSLAPPKVPPQSSYSLPRRKEEREGVTPDPAQSLGRTQSEDSMVDRKALADFRGLVTRPPGDGRSASYGTLDGGMMNGGEKRAVNGEGQGFNGESFPAPPPPVTSLDEGPAPTVDTDSLAPINRLISKFGGGDSSTGPSRGRSKPPTRPKPGNYQRSGSLDVPDGNSEYLAPPSLLSPSPSPIPNPYNSSPPPSSASSSCSSLGRGYRASSKAVPRPLASTSPSGWSAKRVLAKETMPTTQTEKQATPDLLRDQGQSSEVISKEEVARQAVYNILKEGASENSTATKRKVDVIFEKLQDLGVSQSSDITMKAELEECLQENLRLQEQLDRRSAELQQSHAELTQLRMEREVVEQRGRVLEDQLAQQQEDLRRDLLSAQADLSEAVLLQHRLEDTLRQRERELTALKGALKEEVATHDQEIEALREQYAQDMERLKSSMEQVSQSQQGIEAERQKVNASMNSLEQQLESTTKELGATKWKRPQSNWTESVLLQARVEKEEFEEELKELQERLNTMQDQMPDSSHPNTLAQDLYKCQDSLKLARSDLEQLKTQLDKKKAELLTLKKASEEREAQQSQEIDRLKHQSQRDKEELTKALEKTKEPAEAGWEAERLKDKMAAAQRELQAQRTEQQELQETNARLRDKIIRLEARLQSSTSESSEAELVLEEENRSLRTQLEEARRGATRLGQEREELSRQLEERDREREVLRRGKSDVEEQKRLLDRSLGKITKEMEQLSTESRQSVQGLQAQLEDFRERSRKELQETQRQAKDRLGEIQRAQGTARSLQEEVLRLKKELLLSSEQRDSAQLEKELLSNRLKHSEEELEAERSHHGDRSREIRALEDQVKQLEMDLDEEKTNSELLSDRATRSRDQVDQLRSELMQERSCRQDVEVDKSVLERQVKELRGRLADVEDQVRPSTGVSLLESKVQELEARLLSEEREKTSLLSAQRRLERKLKELNITLEEERQRHFEQKDQLALRVKALKRQVDDREGEVERLEGLRRKAIREGEEQLEQMDVLQARVSTLEAELKRRTQQSRRPLLSSEEDEGLEDSSSIASLLSDRHLQAS
ncbi:hypothetical protein GJAV_G00102490 [Gymnothorax javanicus]|nr:hypothetical protein GJAV_G00102490 [Gymnothorax javanicus]